MIGTRTPFRISFAGGGSDLPSFYTRHPGCVLSAAINKYMYIFIHPFFDQKTQVKYSRTELVDDVSQIRHPIVRTALEKFGIAGVDVNSIADIPAGTGLGSSCSFTVGLLHALYAYTNRFASKEKLAREACQIEIDLLGEPIGKQDQYAAAFGNLNFITFHGDESVQVEPVIMLHEKRIRLAENLMMFYLGGSRAAGEILRDQQQAIRQDPQKFHTMVTMTELAKYLRNSLVCGNIDDVGLILDEGWRRKKSLSPRISEDRIDYYYGKAKQNGATGGKLLGAGGGGFLLLYCEKQHQDKLRRALGDLRELDFAFDSFGTQIIYYEENEIPHEQQNARLCDRQRLQRSRYH